MLKNRNKEAIRLIYDYYGETLYGIVLRIVKTEKEAEDVLQESYIKIWRNVENYDAQKGRLFTWLINICRNTALDRVRSKQYKIMKQKVNDVNVEAIRQINYFNSDIIDLQQVIEGLTPDLKKIIDLIYFEGYSHRETATLLEMPLGTVKSKVRRAIKKMRGAF